MVRTVAKAFLVSAVALLAGHAQADVSLMDYQKKKDSKEMQAYLSGVLTGYEWANIDLAKRGAPKLYCLRKDKISNKDTALDVLDQFIQKQKGLNPNWPIELILMASLKEQFPC